MEGSLGRDGIFGGGGLGECCRLLCTWNDTGVGGEGSFRDCTSDSKGGNGALRAGRGMLTTEGLRSGDSGIVEEADDIVDSSIRDTCFETIWQLL